MIMETFESNRDLTAEVIKRTNKELSEFQETIIAKNTIQSTIAKINKIPDKPININYPETIKNPDKFPGSINIWPAKPDESHPLMITLDNRKFMVVSTSLGSVKSVNIKDPWNVTISVGWVWKTYNAEKLTDLLFTLWGNKTKKTKIEWLSWVNIQEV